MVPSFSSPAFAATKGQYLVGRPGVGFSNQLKLPTPALSFKFHQSSTLSFSGLMGLSTSDANGGMGAGIKIYRHLYKEPNLYFYASILGALLRTKLNNFSKSGYQLDLTLGSEFFFQGLSSIGFSIDFGISLNKKYDDFVIETLGDNFLKAQVHFYL